MFKDPVLKKNLRIAQLKFFKKVKPKRIQRRKVCKITLEVILGHKRLDEEYQRAVERD